MPFIVILPIASFQVRNGEIAPFVQSHVHWTKVSIDTKVWTAAGAV
jgi:hypothetical protein